MIILPDIVLFFEDVPSDGVADGPSCYLVILDIAGLGGWDFPYVGFFTEDFASLLELMD